MTSIFSKKFNISTHFDLEECRHRLEFAKGGRKFGFNKTRLSSIIHRRDIKGYEFSTFLYAEGLNVPLCEAKGWLVEENNNCVVTGEVRVSIGFVLYFGLLIVSLFLYGVLAPWAFLELLSLFFSVFGVLALIYSIKVGGNTLISSLEDTFQVA